MTADDFLARLERVSRNGENSWRCQCPAHGGHSLSVKLIDGRILLKCWAGCETAEVLSALGLSFADLFERPLGEFKPLQRSPWTRSDIHELVMREALLIAIVSSDVLEQRTISETDWHRLAAATNRLTQMTNAVRL